jgi:hypothetical protein
MTREEPAMHEEIRVNTIAQEEQGIWDLAYQAYSVTLPEADKQSAREQFIARDLLTAEELDVMGQHLAAGLALQRRSSQRASSRPVPRAGS